MSMANRFCWVVSSLQEDRASSIRTLSVSSILQMSGIGLVFLLTHKTNVPKTSVGSLLLICVSGSATQSESHNLLSSPYSD